MANITQMPSRENVWSLTKTCLPGETYPLAGYNVTVVRIVEPRDVYNLAEVSVGDPLKDGTPHLSFTGVFRG